MFTAFLLLSSLACLKAFTPKSGTARRAPRISMAVIDSNSPGVTAPFGLFDPLGLSSSISDRTLKVWREAELKHGRVAMLASLGILAGEGWGKFGLFENRIEGPAIYHFQQIQELWPSFWLAILFSVSIVELYNVNTGWESWQEKEAAGENFSALKKDYINGDLNFDPLRLMEDKPSGEKKMTEKFVTIRNCELNNGRLAMLGVAGMIAQEVVDKRQIIEHIREFGLGPAREYGGSTLPTHAMSEAADSLYHLAITALHLP